MGRPKRRGRKLKKQESDNEDDVAENGPDPESEEYYHDAVDRFNLDREKIMLDTEADDSEDEFHSLEDEEVIGLDLPESDEEEFEENENEEEDSEDDNTLPNDKSWGKKKSNFYNADATEQEIGSDEEAWEMEKEEEVEAMALQQRMAAVLDEDDFDTADFKIPQEDDTEDKPAVADEEINRTVVMDLTKLSKEQKLEILFRESPELFELLDEFKAKLEELATNLSPLLSLSKLGKLSVEGSKYVSLKYKLYLNYCINIGFYLLLKSKQVPVKDHPVIERIVQYRNLIKELEPIDKKLESDIEYVLKNRDNIFEESQQGNISKATKLPKQASEKTVKANGKTNKSKKISALLDDSDDDLAETLDGEPLPKKKKKASEESVDGINPLDYYEKVRLEKKRTKEIKDLAARLAHEPDLDLEDLDVNEEGKRAITYQISKNKGLTAKKKKEDRNPRVKHRKKYSKAIVKRKSQIRPVVTEMTRYDGEKSGIRAFLTRSVKIK